MARIDTGSSPTVEQRANPNLNQTSSVTESATARAPLTPTKSLLEALSMSREIRGVGSSLDDGEEVTSGERDAHRSGQRGSSSATRPLRGESPPMEAMRDGRGILSPTEATSSDGATIQSSGRIPRLRELFELQRDEILVTEYMCALHSKILLQGKMYVFERHVCFYSNVFGYTTRVKIPFEDVTLINRAKTAVIFPNAIEITHGAKTDFFTSFVFPEKSFKVICHQWARVSHYGKLNGAISAKTLKTALSSPSERTLSDELSGESEEEEEEEEEDLVGGKGIDDDSDVVADDDDMPVDFGNTPTARVSGNAPPLPSSSINVYSGEIDCSVEEFFLAGFSDKSRTELQPKVSMMLEQTNVNITEWKYKRTVGCVRDVVFTAPVKQSFGPKSTRCHQNQSYGVYEDKTLVLWTSQIQSDIPYGDYFRVEARWMLRPLSKKSCSITVGTEVIFTKSTIMKGLIVGSVVDESKAIVTKTIDTIVRKINPPKKAKKVSIKEVVDFNSLHIPEDSQDIVASMLKPIKTLSSKMQAEFVEADTVIKKTCILCSKASKVAMALALVVLAHTMFSIFADWLLGAFTQTAFGFRWSRAYDDAAYWEARSRVLNNELTALERRLGYLAKEVELARANALDLGTSSGTK